MNDDQTAGRRTPLARSSWSSRWGSYQLHILTILPLLWLIMFRYAPMYGAQISFREFNYSLGILRSPWVGWKYFIKFAKAYNFWSIVGNTVTLSAYRLVAGFPIPIILALAINNARSRVYRKTVQMATYLPHFISVVVMVGILIQFLSPEYGIVNKLLKAVGLSPVRFMASPGLFKHVFVWSGVWQNAGWGSIIYLAALSSIDPELHEAAVIDGATRVQRTWYVDIPGILPTAVILLIMNTGRIMNIGFEKVYLMQNPLNLRASEIISTYVYKVGLASTVPNYSYATAIGLFNAVINLILIVAVNRTAKRLGETSLW